MQLNASCTPGGPGGRQNVTVITEDKHMYVRMYPVHIACTGYWVLGGVVAMVTVTSSVSVLPKRCGWREESQRLVSGGYSRVSGGYSLVSGGYSPVSGGYSPVSGGYSLVSGGYSLVSGDYSLVSGLCGLNILIAAIAAAFERQRVYPLKEVPSPGLRWGGLSVSS